jgi:hypothetical protein
MSLRDILFQGTLSQALRAKPLSQTTARLDARLASGHDAGLAESGYDRCARAGRARLLDVALQNF